MTDLGTPARLYVLGYCRGNSHRAEAVARVLFLKHPEATVAREMKVPYRSLQRLTIAVRAGFRELIVSGAVETTDLLARE